MRLKEIVAFENFIRKHLLKKSLQEIYLSSLVGAAATNFRSHRLQNILCTYLRNFSLRLFVKAYMKKQHSIKRY